MDIVCVAIFAFYFVRGCFKGLLNMLFSLVGFFVVAFLAYQISKLVFPFAESFAEDAILKTIQTFLNGAVPGQFLSVTEFKTALSQTKIGLIFSVLLSKILPNIAFDGSLTAGQILAPTLSTLALKVLCFVAVFIVLEVVLKLLRYFLEKFIKKCGLSFGNRILGGILGLVKALFVFALVFFVLWTLANLFANQWLLEFVESGKISQFVYHNLAEKIFGLLY